MIHLWQQESKPGPLGHHEPTMLITLSLPMICPFLPLYKAQLDLTLCCSSMLYKWALPP